MKSFLTISVAAATMTLGLMAQKLETQKPDPTKVLRVETAKDHLTVIELSDAVTMVAVGNRVQRPRPGRGGQRPGARAGAR